MLKKSKVWLQLKQKKRRSPESITQSEISQKDKYCILVHIHKYMEFREMVTTTLYARQQREPDVKNRLLDSVGEGEDRMI